MKKRFVFASILIGFLACSNTCAAFNADVPKQQITSRIVEVSDINALNKAIAAAKPGDVIVMADGTWNDAEINFNANATEKAPITLKAKTAGKVILSGNSTLEFAKPYLVVDGLFFTNGAIKGNTVVEFKSDHCRLINTAIVDYNPAEKKTDYYWIYFNGNHNRMEHCFFKGKNNLQPLVGNDQDDSRYNTVAYCHFKDVPHTPDNGREIFRIWGYGRSEETGDDGAYFTIENNLFERAHGEGSEIISLKSNRNVVRYNTIVSTRGGITGRSGNFNTIEGNFIFGNNEKGTSGIRLAGQGHRVVNNYISDVTGDGVIIMCGEYIDTALTPNYQPILRAGTPLGRVPRYGHVKDGVFSNNTLVNIGGIGINIGSSYNASPNSDQRVLIPENNRIVNNLVYHAKGTGVSVTVASTKPPLDRFSFKPNILEANISYGAPTNASNNGIIVLDPRLTLKDGVYCLSPGSIAIDKGASIDLREDVDGQARSSKMDIGADEFSATQIKRKPLTATNVGPQWVIKSRSQSPAQF